MRFFYVTYSAMSHNSHGFGSFYASVKNQISINEWTSFVNENIPGMENKGVVIINFVEMSQEDWESCTKEKESETR